METEKEMKKLLLVAISVGAFLLITVTVSLILLMPRAHTQDAIFYAPSPITQLRPPAEITAPSLPEVDELPVIAAEEERPEVTIGDNRVGDRIDGDRVTIQIPTPTAVAIPEAVIPAHPAPAARAPTPAPAPAARPAAPAAPAARAPAPAPAARPAAPAAPRARTITDYWIQAGAFSAVVRAEDARELLASKGLVSIIENREINGRTWYRVRIGPYTSAREANHWLAIVQEIDGFHESQVRQTFRTQ